MFQPEEGTQEKPRGKIIDLPRGQDRKVYHTTEMGNAERVYDKYGEDFLYTPSHGFLTWTGKQWLPDSEHKVFSYCQRTIQDMYEEAGKLLEMASQEVNKQVRKQLSQEAEALNVWARRSETLKDLNSMVGLLKRDERLYSDIGMFDRHPYLLNCLNGTVDVRTGELRPHNREDFLTQLCPYAYIPEAQAPTFEAFYADIMLQDKDMMHYVQKCLGYGLTADTTAQAFFLLLGQGENGKSTLLNTIQKVLGHDYTTTLNDASIVVSRPKDGGSASPDIADLKGKRLVTVSETEDGTKLATQLIKRMTGGDTEKARKLHKDPFTFQYTHKLFIYTNHELMVKETGHGFWRRVHRIPFDYTVPKHKKDETLVYKLEAEAEGILSWLITGAKAWAKEGLERPERVQKATDEYRKSQDFLQQFVDETCTEGPDLKEKASTLFEAFKKWQEEAMNMHAVTGPTFKRMMLDHRYKYKHDMYGRWYVGLQLAGKKKAPGKVVSTSGEGKEAGLDLSLEVDTQGL